MAVDSATTTLIHRIHTLLGQNPTSASNLVSDALILDYLNDGIEQACLLGKIYPKRTTITTLGHDKPFITISTDLETANTAISDAWYIGVASIYGADNIALSQCKVTDRGRLFYASETLTTTTDYPLYWYEFGGLIQLLPVYATGGDHITMTVEWYGKPKGKLVEDATTTATVTFETNHYSTTGDVMTYSGTELPTGTAIYFTNSGGALPTGLTAYRMYYTRLVAATHYLLYTTEAAAVAGTLAGSESFTTAGTGTTTMNNLTAAPDYAIGTSGCPIDRRHWPTLVNYALYRGKQAYNAHSESSGFLQAFAQALGVDIEEAKRSVGEV